MESVKNENIEPDPKLDNETIVSAPQEVGEIPIEMAENSFVQMIKDLSQKEVETAKPTKRQLSLGENSTKKIKVKRRLIKLN